MPSAPVPLAPLPTEPPAAAATAAQPFTRRQQLVLLGILSLLNVVAWWWFTRGGTSTPEVPRVETATASAAALPIAASSVPASTVAGKPPITDVGPAETVLSVLPARTPRAAEAPASGAGPVPRTTEASAGVPRALPESPPPLRVGAAMPAVTGSEALAGPRARCGDRNFLSMLVCMKRECGDPALRSHPECVKMREQEESLTRPSPR
jgi:hypothetical protein